MVVVVEEHTGLELIDETHGECVWNVRIAFGKVGLRLGLRLGEKVGTGKAGSVSGIEIRVAYGVLKTYAEDAAAMQWSRARATSVR